MARGASVSRAESFVLSGGKPERPFIVDAPAVMNAQAALDDTRKFLARQARIHRDFAAQNERMAQAITATLLALAESIAATERAR